MILDSEEQRQIILEALMKVQVVADYQGLCDVFPKMQATVEAVKSASIKNKES